jgi:hypothetical protein
MRHPLELDLAHVGVIARGIIKKKTTCCVISTLLVPGVSGGASDEAGEEEEGSNLGESFGRVATLFFFVD